MHTAHDDAPDGCRRSSVGGYAVKWAWESIVYDTRTVKGFALCLLDVASLVIAVAKIPAGPPGSSRAPS